MNLITETLLFPYRKTLLERPAPDSRLLFLNAENPAVLEGRPATLLQPRHDRALPFIEAGYEVLSDIPPPRAGRFDTVWVLPGKDRQETQYLLALAAGNAGNGGKIVAAAPNDAGGRRLEELFAALSLPPSAESKHKARVVYAEVGKEWNKELAALWLEEGKEQPILNGTVLSRPGLHSWREADAGSAVLARHLPADLAGHVADFGCGWGYLSLQAAALSKNITRLTLADIDARAVDLARRNLQNRHPALRLDTLWADLTRPATPPGPFDVILLNPPFHAGTHAVPAIGQAIIATAARSLAPPGRLYLVANKHLPYEKTLRAIFSRVDLLAEENGFKALLCRL